MDQSRLEILVYLPSQIVDIDIDEIGTRVKMRVPHILLNLGSTHHAARILHQVLQQRKLLGGKMDWDAVSCALVLMGNQLQTCNRKFWLNSHLGLTGRSSTKQHRDARQKFPKVKGLGKVVIRTRIKTLKFVVGGSQCGQ